MTTKICDCGKEFDTDFDEDLCERCGVIQEAVETLRAAAQHLLSYRIISMRIRTGRGRNASEKDGAEHLHQYAKWLGEKADALTKKAGL